MAGRNSWAILAAGLAGCLMAWSHAGAATYYVDASAGSDAWLGTSPDPVAGSSTQGPWRSLARVRQAALLPGDAVLLKCGQAWEESLAWPSSGTASQPVTLGSFPAGCADRPRISGGSTVPAANWFPYSGSKWKARYPVNMVGDGDFDTGIVGWKSWSTNSTAALKFSTTCSTGNAGCMRFTSEVGTYKSIVSSTTFPLQAGKPYTVTFRMNAPAGVQVTAVLRKAASPWTVYGLSNTYKGAGTWKQYTVTATDTAGHDDARLDFEVPDGGYVVYLDDVRVTTPSGTPMQLFSKGQFTRVAHFPDAGINPAAPNSIYAKVAADSPVEQVNGVDKSRSLIFGADLVLPKGASLRAGLKTRLRSRAWPLEELTLNSANGNTLTFTDYSKYTTQKDWGYYLTGALWMVSTPGEWAYDPSGWVIAWLPDSLQPDGSVVIGRDGIGLDLGGKAYVRVDNIQVQYFSTGIALAGSTGVAILNSVVTDTAGAGVDVSSASRAILDANQLLNTGFDAIAGDVAPNAYATFLTATHNTIANSGVRYVDGQILSLPGPAVAAINAGRDAIVEGNTLDNLAYVGIRADLRNQIRNNVIRNACLVLDDGGGIYIKSTDNNGVVSGNLIEGVIGSGDGKPDGTTQAVGLYLDDWTSGALVEGNSVTNADYGVQVHNAFNNVIQANTLAGNRVYQIWLQENTNKLNVGGDLYGNTILDNTLVPFAEQVAIYATTSYDSTKDFAQYDGNVYSTLRSDIIAQAYQPATGTLTYQFGQWQAQPSPEDPDGNEVHGRTVDVAAYAQFEVQGATVLPNGNFSSGLTGWKTWNSAPPYGTMTLATCEVGPCLQYAAGGTDSLLSSPNFPVVKDQWYRLAFDIKGSRAGQAVGYLVRRGGPNNLGYDSIMGPQASVTVGTAWQRVALLFKSTMTINVNDPVTGDLGARLDFGWIPKGDTLSVANVELVPVSSVDESTQIRYVSNPSGVTASIPCPDLATAPDLCAKFAAFTTGEPVVWPVPLGPYESMVVYTRDTALVDGDLDGIPDGQDACPATPAGAVVNASGCSL